MSRQNRLRLPGKAKRTTLLERSALAKAVAEAVTTEKPAPRRRRPPAGEAPGKPSGDDGWEAWQELRDAVDRWLCRQEGARYQTVIDRLAGDWLGLIAGQPGWDAPSVDLLGDLAVEFGLVMHPDRTGGGTDDNALLAFAADPFTPPALAGRARMWRSGIRYGLWRVDAEPSRRLAGAGLPCTDILSGRMRTIVFPARVTERLVRWALWYGAVLPDRGRWHATGLGARLSPAEGDAAAEFILAGAAAATLGQAGEPAAALASATLSKPMRFGGAEPHGVAVDYEPPFPDDVAVTVSRMAGASIARVLGETYRYRAMSPAPRNGSDEPACLIAARLTVTSASRLRTALAGRDDFAVSREDPAVVAWIESGPPGSPRVALGSLRFAGARGCQKDTVLAQVNSAARFGYLLALLGKLDPGLTVSHEKHVDPVLHTAWPGETRTERSASADGWEQFWLDTPLEVLGHQTPRQAVRSRRLPELLTLLRQFEYQAALLVFEGKSGLDTGAIRAELGVAEPPANCGHDGDLGTRPREAAARPWPWSRELPLHRRSEQSPREFGEGRDHRDAAVRDRQAPAVQPYPGQARGGRAAGVGVGAVADVDAAFRLNPQQSGGVPEDPRVGLGDADVGGRHDRGEGARQTEGGDLGALLNAVAVGDQAQLHVLPSQGGQAGPDVGERRPARLVALAVGGEPFQFVAGRDGRPGAGGPGPHPGGPLLVEGQLARQVARVVLLVRLVPGGPRPGRVEPRAPRQQPGQARGHRGGSVEQGVVEVEQHGAERGRAGDLVGHSPIVPGPGGAFSSGNRRNRYMPIPMVTTSRRGPGR